jgi:hypothetical protein
MKVLIGGSPAQVYIFLAEAWSTSITLRRVVVLGRDE